MSFPVHWRKPTPGGLLIDAGGIREVQAVVILWIKDQDDSGRCFVESGVCPSAEDYEEAMVAVADAIYSFKAVAVYHCPSLSYPVPHMISSGPDRLKLTWRVMNWDAMETFNPIAEAALKHWLAGPDKSERFMTHETPKEVCQRYGN